MAMKLPTEHHTLNGILSARSWINSFVQIIWPSQQNEQHQTSTVLITRNNEIYSW